ncbi:MAG: RluA family pseudouridine synthase [Burkholderiaceae bacterium]|nr:RluA family pseudouridine synthase [Burkholderiaceae bacterium]
MGLDDPGGPGIEEPADISAERRQAIVSTALHGSRLDKALVSMAGEFSRNHLQALVESAHVWVDGRLQTSASRKVLAGQVVTVELMPTQECLAFRPEPMMLDIVYEDEYLMVVNKPAGMVVHPAAGNWSGTLLNGLLAHHGGAGHLPRAGIVHRLDKDTSGLMVVGKTLTAVTALVRQIAARDVRRIYLAVCHGRFEHQHLRIEAPIGRDPRSRVRMAVVSSGRSARTDVERLAVRSDDSGHSVSALRCSLHTGRTHQIRVHLASVGHPLLADATYGGREGHGMTRQALHATRLGFDHPVGGQPLAFEVPPPPDLAQVWQLLMATD